MYWYVSHNMDTGDRLALAQMVLATCAEYGTQVKEDFEPPT